jgi:hypothetical protein
MLNAIAGDPRTGVSAASSSGRTAGTGGSAFEDILVSSTGTSGASARATATAATAASADVDGLSKLVQALGANAKGADVGVKTIDRSGDVIAGASLDASGDLSVVGTGSFGNATSSIDMSLSAGDGSWYANASSELAQASYELNALAAQSMAAAGVLGVDRAA